MCLQLVLNVLLARLAVASVEQARERLRCAGAFELRRPAVVAVVMNGVVYLLQNRSHSRKTPASSRTKASLPTARICEDMYLLIFTRTRLSNLSVRFKTTWIFTACFAARLRQFCFQWLDLQMARAVGGYAADVALPGARPGRSDFSI